MDEGPGKERNRMAFRIPPPALFALILGTGLLLCLPQMMRERAPIAAKGR